jgi:hypothetical protein
MPEIALERSPDLFLLWGKTPASVRDKLLRISHDNKNSSTDDFDHPSVGGSRRNDCCSSSTQSNEDLGSHCHHSNKSPCEPIREVECAASELRGRSRRSFNGVERDKLRVSSAILSAFSFRRAG